MIGIPLGLAYVNVGEWLIHKHVLHGLGKDKASFWSFHFHEHHKKARKHDHFDSDYERPLSGWNGKTKEALGLVGLGLLHAPLLPVAPFFTGTVVYGLVHYYRAHKRAHLDPAWAKENLPWHYDHHMGPDQDQNWCVTKPWFDRVMGTRVPYLGTEREAADRARREAREQGELRADAAAEAAANGSSRKKPRKRSPKPVPVPS